MRGSADAKPMRSDVEVGPYQASQKPINRIRTRVVKTSQGIMTTSTLILRTAGMSLSTFGSRSKNRCRFQKIYAPPNKLTMKKNVAAIRKAGRTEGLSSASMIFSIVLCPLFSQASKAEHFTDLFLGHADEVHLI